MAFDCRLLPQKPRNTSTRICPTFWSWWCCLITFLSESCEIPGVLEKNWVICSRSKMKRKGMTPLDIWASSKYVRWRRDLSTGVDESIKFQWIKLKELENWRHDFRREKQWVNVLARSWKRLNWKGWFEFEN